MHFLIGLENGDENRSQAWSLEYPGCFAYGPDGRTALVNIAPALIQYADWVEAKSGQRWFDPGELEIFLDDTWQVYFIDESYDRVSPQSQPAYAVNAWFQHDWKPLQERDIERGLALLAWGRQDLLEIIQELSPEVLEKRFPGEKTDINGILKHIGGAEWWYLSRLGLEFPQEELPVDYPGRLEKSRSRLMEALPGLAGSTQVIGIEGEFWSPRKLLRRAVWHERDHTFHILKLWSRDEGASS
jgi:hypothetical protein